MNTRLYLIDRARMRERMLPMELLGPIRLISRMKAGLHGNPPFAAAELVISSYPSILASAAQASIPRFRK